MPVLRPGLVFIHIPKCAGTSLEVAAGFDRQYPTLGLQPTAADADAGRLFGGGLEHLSSREVRAQYPALWENARVFSIVRDPIERFVSHFVWRFYRFSQNPPPVQRMLLELRAFIDEHVKPAAEHTLFADPHRGIDADVHPNDVFRHLLPQCTFLFDRGELAVDEIYHMRELDDVAAMLHREHGFQPQLPRRMVGASSGDLRHHLPADVEAFLHDLYSADAAFIASRFPSYAGA